VVFADFDADGSGDIDRLVIHGNILGGSTFGGLAGQSARNSGYVHAVNIGVNGPAPGAFISGTVLAGVNGGAELFNSGAVRATDTIGLLVIGGDLRGNSINRPIVSALNGITDLRLRADVVFADILVGYGPSAFLSYTLSGDFNPLGVEVKGPALLDADTGLGLDVSDPALFNDSATLDSLVVTKNFYSSNLVVSVDPVNEVLGTSDDDPRTGTISFVRVNGLIGSDSGFKNSIFVIAADTITDLKGKSNPGGVFTHADANDITLGPAFNVATHADLDFSTDFYYVPCSTDRLEAGDWNGKTGE
jgi:hypothetical protein